MYYLDANSTARMRPQVKEVLAELCAEDGLLGNPSSIHSAGRGARAKVSQARREILQALGVANSKDARLIFTSGGTEACNTLIHGFLDTTAKSQKGHIVASAIEHQAILEPLKLLAERGFKVTLVEPEEDGRIDAQKFLAEITSQTSLVALMAANNVTGAIQPVIDVAKELRGRGFPGAIISDVTQLVGKSSISAADVLAAGVDGIALSGHKIGAPAGIGAIVLNAAGDLCHDFSPSLLGGPQEERFRAGSENLIGILGFAAAAKALSEDELTSIIDLRKLFASAVTAKIPGARRLSPEDTDGSKCLSNTLAFSFAGVRADDLVVAFDLKSVCVSTGSACSSGRQDASHVFTAMGLSKAEAKEAIRISFDWDVTAEQLNEVLEILGNVVEQVRAVEKAA